MTLLTVCQALARNVGLSVPSVIVTSPLREWQEAYQFANDVGEELARRVQWGKLHVETTLTGTGAAVVHSLPSSFSRLCDGGSVLASGSLVRQLTRDEWSSLTPVVGTPRYFLLEGQEISFYPFLANAATAKVNYQSKNWVTGSAGYVADTDVALIDEGLLTKGLIVRWRRQKGMDYADYEAEYEQAVADFAKFDDGQRL